MTYLTRRKLIRNTSAGLALATLARPMSTLAQDSNKPTLTVGAKNYTEQLVMAEFLALILEDADYPVERQYGLGGAAVLSDAMISGELDVQVEATPTGMLVAGGSLPLSEATNLSQEEIEERVYTMAAEGYAEQFNIAWLEPFGFRNDWGIAVTQETADEYGLEKMSDLEPVAGDMTLGSDMEFPIREDGLPRFEEAYGFTFGNVQSGDQGLMYSAVDQGDVDVIAAYTTDGRVYALDLVMLEDDKNYSLPYETTPLIHQELLDEHPELEDLLNQLGGEMTVREMADLNYQVDNGNLSVEEVARAFLEEKGILESGD